MSSLSTPLDLQSARYEDVEYERLGLVAFFVVESAPPRHHRARREEGGAARACGGKLRARVGAQGGARQGD
jgi:hypothetical protein